MNKLERDNVKERIEERIFHIRLRNTQNVCFLYFKVIGSQYREDFQFFQGHLIRVCYKIFGESRNRSNTKEYSTNP